MKTETTRFGTLDVPAEEVVEFVSGIPGFEDVKRFVTIEDPSCEPFIWLQSIDRPDLAFLTIPPNCLVADFVPELSDEGREALCIKEGRDIEILAIVTVPDEPRLMTANLRAPIIINRSERIGRQEVGSLGRHSLRHRIIPDAPDKAEALAGR